MSRTTLIVAYFVIAIGVAWPLNTAIVFHDFQSISTGVRIQQNQRMDLGVAMWVGFVSAVIWPIGVPMVFCVSGFAAHGIWSQR